MGNLNCFGWCSPNPYRSEDVYFSEVDGTGGWREAAEVLDTSEDEVELDEAAFTPPAPLPNGTRASKRDEDTSSSEREVPDFLHDIRPQLRKAPPPHESPKLHSTPKSLPPAKPVPAPTEPEEALDEELVALDEVDLSPATILSEPKGRRLQKSTNQPIEIQALLTPRSKIPRTTNQIVSSEPTISNDEVDLSIL